MQIHHRCYRVSGCVSAEAWASKPPVSELESCFQKKICWTVETLLRNCSARKRLHLSDGPAQLHIPTRVCSLISHHMINDLFWFHVHSTGCHLTQTGLKTEERSCIRWSSSSSLSRSSLAATSSRCPSTNSLQLHCLDGTGTSFSLGILTCHCCQVNSPSRLQLLQDVVWLWIVDGWKWPKPKLSE